jgi:tetratricopeptide (TPR) repeat protein
MTHLWRLISGNVPGGFALLLVILVSFAAIWEFIYRAGETLPTKTYRKWRLLGPLIIVVIYALLWVQTPPKLKPRLIAIFPDAGGLSSWQNQAIADITARSLRNTLERALINPWEGASDYTAPSLTVAKKAGYEVFKVEASVSSLEEVETKAQQLGHSVLKTLGDKKTLADPFNSKPDRKALEYYYWGRSEFLYGRLDSARIILSQAVSFDSVFIPALIALARCFELSGDRAGAHSLLITAVRQAATSSEAMLALGEYFLRGFEWDGTESALKVVLADEPMQPRAMLGLTHIHPDRLKDLYLNTPTALAEEAIRLDPAYEQARVVWVDQLTPKGYSAKARKILMQGLEINPESRELWLKLGALDIQFGNPEAARKIYQDLINKDPNDILATFNLGVVQYHTKQYDAALETFRQIQAMDGPVDHLYYLGMIYKIKEDREKARFYFYKRWERRSGTNDEFGQRAGRMVAEIDKKSRD